MIIKKRKYSSTVTLPRTGHPFTIEKKKTGQGGCQKDPNNITVCVLQYSDSQIEGGGAQVIWET